MKGQRRHPTDTVASETGFAGRERMRRAFLPTSARPPQTMRRNARVKRPAVAAGEAMG